MQNILSMTPMQYEGRTFDFHDFPMVCVVKHVMSAAHRWPAERSSRPASTTLLQELSRSHCYKLRVKNHKELLLGVSSMGLSFGLAHAALVLSLAA